MRHKIVWSVVVALALVSIWVISNPSESLAGPAIRHIVRPPKVALCSHSTNGKLYAAHSGNLYEIDPSNGHMETKSAGWDSVWALQSDGEYVFAATGSQLRRYHPLSNETSIMLGTGTDWEGTVAMTLFPTLAGKRANDNLFVLSPNQLRSTRRADGMYTRYGLPTQTGRGAAILAQEDLLFLIHDDQLFKLNPDKCVPAMPELSQGWSDTIGMAPGEPGLAHFYVATKNDLRVVDVHTGSYQSLFPKGLSWGTTLALAFDEQYLFFVSGKGELWQLSRTNPKAVQVKLGSELF